MLENEVITMTLLCNAKISLTLFSTVNPCRYSDYGNKKGLAAIEHFNNTMASMDDQHTMENQILEEMHELLEQDTTRSPSPEKNWFALSKDEVGEMSRAHTHTHTISIFLSIGMQRRG